MASPFAKAKLVMSVSLAPYHIQNAKKGLEDQLSQMLMKYCEPVQGVLLSFNSLQMINPYGHIINETPFIHVRVAADALVFRPTPGMKLSATVNKIGSNHIGLLLAGVFNVSIAATEMPSGFVHNHFEEAWVGEDGASISLQDEVRFKVLQVHEAHGVISIDGTLRSVKQTAESESPQKKKAEVIVEETPKKVKVVKRKHVAFADEVAPEEDDTPVVIEESPEVTKKTKKSKKKVVEDVAEEENDGVVPVKKTKKAKKHSQ
ncbi:unnamed protein product [Aphanomyces euteiches]|uniref:RPA43 OB domain-containing protein n=1 Tax=Aphanomyces euteiches TaxID=100861 RepID=A0A6G0XIV8_9STRA|nr:hypothetical protein Ae201684_004238 [Aphanomyces euteiches]KAH9140068.1 hypothetical protein AeRB84_015675 [Aphanomyces euteiches]